MHVNAVLCQSVILEADSLLPIRSDRLPQNMPVIDSARAKAAMRRPAYNEALLSSPLELSRPIRYAYGNCIESVKKHQLKTEERWQN